MSDFYFFTDPDLLDQQTASQAFGPVAGQEQTHYRLTSLHTATASPKAYAVCDGSLLVQEQPDGLLNIILLPHSQPKNSMPTVQFFIYRGIERSSLVDGDFVAAATNNDITNAVWEAFNRMMSHAIEVEDTGEVYATDSEYGDGVGAESLGLLVQQWAASDALNTVTYNYMDGYGIPLVKAGWHLGDFSLTYPTGVNGFGFEIVFANIDNEPTFGEARAADHVQSITALPGTPTEAETFEHWTEKERVLNYIDPAAYFGSFAAYGLKLGGDTGGDAPLDGVEIYDQIVSKFYRKNTLYLDIRNELNFSFNYFKNYSDTVRTWVGGSQAYQQDFNYYQHWPILLVDMASLAHNGPDNEQSNQFSTRLELGLPVGSNTDALIFWARGVSGSVAGQTEGTPLAFMSDPPQSDRFSVIAQDSDYEYPFFLEVPFANDAPFDVSGTGSFSMETGFSGNSICSYFRLMYLRKKGAGTKKRRGPDNDTELFGAHYLDNLFMPVSLNVPFPGYGDTDDYETSWYVSEHDIYVGNPGSELNYIGKQGISFDAENVTFFTFPTFRHSDDTEQVNVSPALSSAVDEVDDFLYSVELREKKLVATKRGYSLYDAFPPVFYRGLERKLGFAKSLDTSDPSEWVSVSITHSEYADLVALANGANFASWSRIFLCVTSISDDLTGGQKARIKIKLGLRGYEVNTDQSVTVLEIPSSTTIYARYE